MSGLTPREKRVVWIHLCGYSTHRDFTAQEWFNANDEVRTNDKLREYVKNFIK